MQIFKRKPGGKTGEVGRDFERIFRKFTRKHPDISLNLAAFGSNGRCYALLNGNALCAAGAALKLLGLAWRMIRVDDDRASMIRGMRFMYEQFAPGLVESMAAEDISMYEVQE